jgi:hypothetical protein
METHELIKALAADTKRSGMPMALAWSAAAIVAVAVAAGVFLALLGPRSDIANALQTLRFLYKFLVTIALALSALGVLRVLARPEAEPRTLLSYLAIAPALLAAGVLAELVAVPASAWPARLVGSNGLVCLTFIPLIGIGPLALLLLAVRHGAPSYPTLAGSIAGLAAGGIAATFYAAHCTDDSPLFVASWYTAAIAILVLLGGIAARSLVRW